MTCTKTASRSPFAALVLLASLGVAAEAQAQLIFETFDTDAAGFGIFNDALSFGWSPTLGNPGGCITAVDDTAA